MPRTAGLTGALVDLRGATETEGQDVLAGLLGELLIQLEGRLGLPRA